MGTSSPGLFRVHDQPRPLIERVENGLKSWPRPRVAVVTKVPRRLFAFVDDSAAPALSSHSFQLVSLASPDNAGVVHHRDTGPGANARLNGLSAWS